MVNVFIRLLIGFTRLGNERVEMKDNDQVGNKMGRWMKYER